MEDNRCDRMIVHIMPLAVLNGSVISPNGTEKTGRGPLAAKSAAAKAGNAPGTGPLPTAYCPPITAHRPLTTAH